MPREPNVTSWSFVESKRQTYSISNDIKQREATNTVSALSSSSSSSSGSVRPGGRDGSCLGAALGSVCPGGRRPHVPQSVWGGDGRVLHGPGCQRLSGPALGGPTDSAAGGVTQGVTLFGQKCVDVCVCVLDVWIFFLSLNLGKWQILNHILLSRAFAIHFQQTGFPNLGVRYPQGVPRKELRGH